MQQPSPHEQPAPAASVPTPIPEEGARQRRHRETRTAIHLAALELIERDGLAHTTVAKVAAHAGVSARTFFRYFPNKEQAALPGQQRLLETLQASSFTAETPQQGLIQIEHFFAEFMAQESAEIDAHQRIFRLLEAEAPLRAHAAMLDLTVIEELTHKLQQALPEEPLETLHVIAETSLNVWRQGWARWARLSVAHTGPTAPPSPEACYADLRGALRRVLKATP